MTPGVVFSCHSPGMASSLGSLTWRGAQLARRQRQRQQGRKGSAVQRRWVLLETEPLWVVSAAAKVTAPWRACAAGGIWQLLQLCCWHGLLKNHARLLCWPAAVSSWLWYTVITHPTVGAQEAGVQDISNWMLHELRPLGEPTRGSLDKAVP
jgi:hypothetical protein